MRAIDTPLAALGDFQRDWHQHGVVHVPGALGAPGRALASGALFHPGILHGGGPTPAHARRRTLSLRFFGDQAYCAARPEAGLHESDRLVRDDDHADPMANMAMQPEGTLFRHPGFIQVLPENCAGEGRQHA